MLHEVLLALSGHTSPLFKEPLENDRAGRNTNVVNQDFPDLSSSEAALLRTVGRLSLLHRRLRHALRQIIDTHASTVCRAVAASLLYTSLGRFQEKILDVERRILTEDATIVGAYNIVPLSGVVGEFDEWTRRMTWYWEIASFISSTHGLYTQPTKEAPSTTEATGASLIDHLRSEAQTGFPDIEAAARELSIVAETAWLKQLSTWILYGLTPRFGASDFFIRSEPSTNDRKAFSISTNLLPDFVTEQTAASLLFIGKSLHEAKQQVRSDGPKSAPETSEDVALTSTHLQMMSALSLPLSPNAFSRTIASVRLSLSQKVLQRILPMAVIVRVLLLLRDYFLLRSSDFATALIQSSEVQMVERQAGLGNLLPDASSRDLKGVMIKEGEIAETLARTWKALLATHVSDEGDEALEFAQESISLDMVHSQQALVNRDTIADMSSITPSDVAFNDFLFPVRTALTMQTDPPLDLFLATSDIRQHSTINSYLLALRRSHLRLSNLWRLSATRRSLSKEQRGDSIARHRDRKRHAGLRKVWATCSAALFLLSETSAYFEGEIVHGFWNHFYHWATVGSESSHADGARVGSHPMESSMYDLSISVSADAQQHQHDPETLALGHRAFLASLIYALLLTDTPFTRVLRTFMTDVDHLIAFFERLLRIRQTLDLEGEEAISVSVTEEPEAELELDRARKRADSSMKSLVHRLRQLDHERIGSARYADLGPSPIGSYSPWKGGGVDRLLMKLDFGRLSHSEEDEFR